MPKEKNYNPVQAQRKADKAKEVKKGKAEAQSRRNEKLAFKNPERLQKQIDDLETVAKDGRKLTRHEEQVLEGLEKELKAVKRARETLGDKAPTFGRGWRRDDGSRPGALGKRRRGNDGSSSEEDVPEDVRRIPLPHDTPPPIPKAEMDAWHARRRARREAENATRRDNVNGFDADKWAKEKTTAAVESKTVYEAKPIVRDLKKEAVAAFVPASVQMKLSRGQGQGGLMEPEEADRLEKEGYLQTARAGTEQGAPPSRRVAMEEAEEEDGSNSHKA